MSLRRNNSQLIKRYFSHPNSVVSHVSYSKHNNISSPLAVRDMSRTPATEDNLKDYLSKDFSQVKDSITPQYDIDNLYKETTDSNTVEVKPADTDFSLLSFKSPNTNPILNRHICIYSIEKTKTVSPFFKYLFIWNNETSQPGQYEFPKKEIKIELPSSDNEENTESYFRTQIMNDCIEYITDVFDLHSNINTEYLSDIFKGFIWKKETNDIYLFFELSEDISKNKPSMENKSSIENNKILKWVILHEIISKGYVDYSTAPISKEIIQLFKENTFLKTLYIEDSKNKFNKISVEYPLTMYLCQSKPDSAGIIWENVIEPELSPEATPSTPNTVDFPLLGEFYYFSSNPLISDDSTKKYKKYAVFLNVHNGEHLIEESYIIKDVSEINEEQWKNYRDKIRPENVSTIWFKEKGIQLWAVKYPTQITSF